MSAAEDSMTPAQARHVLGVSLGASQDVVKKAYRGLLGDCHPDKAQGAGMPKELIDAATIRMAEINRAYDVLRPDKQSGDETDRLWQGMGELLQAYGGGHRRSRYET